jgi:cyanate permease
MDDLVNQITDRSRKARAAGVCASTQYGMGYLLAVGGPNDGGIVFRDDALSHEDRSALADKVNGALKEFK